MTAIASRNLPLEEQVLLRELNHRINNEFASLVSLVTLAAARSGNNDVKLALRHVTDLIHNCADVHHALQMPEDDACAVDAAAYLRKLCLSIKRSKLDRTKIGLVLSARPMSLRSDQCWLLGMIVHELVCNAVRHAFSAGQGEIRIVLSLKGTLIECKVLDNGTAPVIKRPGRGLKIIDVLAKRLNGRFAQQFSKQGSTSNLVFPRNSGPQRAFHLALHAS
ncbi:MAG TPA: sensor histidine kinase [Xanthobacteraceae bacterium]|nr:sensor histidine kinase [Xanthobacteraceae bacterium]